MFKNGYPNRMVNSAITRKLQNFENQLHLAQINVRLICIFHGYTLFRRASKNRLRHHFAVATSMLLNQFCIRSSSITDYPKRRTSCFFNTAILFVSILASAKVDT